MWLNYRVGNKIIREKSEATLESSRPDKAKKVKTLFGYMCTMKNNIGLVKTI